MLQVCYFLNKAVVVLDNRNLNICSLLMSSHFLIPKTVCMYMHIITNLPTLTVPLSILGFRPLLTYRSNWKIKHLEIHFLQNTGLKKINTTTAGWATPSINCSR